MKEYNKPILNEELLDLEDIIATSGDFGESEEGEARRSFIQVFGG